MIIGDDGRYYYTYEIYIDNPQHPMNGHYYYGKHVTKKLDDDYYGSGKIVTAYLDEIGVVGLRKTILCFYRNQDELNKAEQELVATKKAELKDLCCNLHGGGRDGHWVEYVTPEERAARREKAIKCLYEKTTPESRKESASKAGQCRRKQIMENRQEWVNTLKTVHANRTQEQKRNIYNKVADSLREYYSSADSEVIAQKNLKNKATNVESARLWRSEFQRLFSHTPEYFRKFKAQGAALALYKKICNESQEVQENEIKRFMESIN